MTLKMSYLFALVFTLGVSSASYSQARTATLDLKFDKPMGPVAMDHISLGQGGLSEYPMWDNRIAEVRALHPRLIRLFVQEYFDVLPASDKYHFDTLDQSVDEILKAGAKPLMSIAIKPKVLFPVVDEKIVDPQDYAKWEELIFQMVSHYKARGLEGLYWEVANEPDIGETGGSPYFFTAENYPRYYQHTVAAILRADPRAHVGGPALAGWKSPILPALLAFCDREKVPLSFVSWHIYDSDPIAVEGTIKSVKALIAKHPSLHPETILDEWNMALTVPPTDVRIQPAFVVETAWRMKEQGLDYSCYYHIRDYHVDRDRFAAFFSLRGASFMASWWNRMPQYSGLFDYQDRVRPAYFAFLLMSRATGQRLGADSRDTSVHAFLSYDESYGIYNLLLWNYSATPVSVDLNAHGLPVAMVAKRRSLDAVDPSDDENVRLRPMPDVALKPGEKIQQVRLEPYGIESWSLEPRTR
jgi:xylan 1,4-beta-xylosidase